MLARLTVLLTLTVPLWAGNFYSGQAARAVFGQSSFSAKDAGIQATSLFLSEGRLYAVDSQHRLFAYDLTALARNVEGMTSDGASCAFCLVQPAATLANFDNAPPSQMARSGNTLVGTDAANHRVLIWRDSQSVRSLKSADVVLSGFSDPVSVAIGGKRLFVGDAALHRVFIWNSIPLSPDQSPDVILGSNALLGATLSADTFGAPIALAADDSNLFVADADGRRVLMFSQADHALQSNAIANSASLVIGPIAPGGLITIGSEHLSDSTEAAPDDGLQNLPRKLAGVAVLLDGVALPMLSVAPNQLRAQIPYRTAKTSASLYVRTEHVDGSLTTTTPVALKIESATPGLFAFAGPEPRDGMVIHADGTPITAQSPAVQGETITAWAAGLGSVTAPAERDPRMGVPYDSSSAPVTNSVAALVNGQSAQVVSATLPQGSIGIYEVKVALPAMASRTTEVALLIMQNGVVSNTIVLPLAISPK